MKYIPNSFQIANAVVDDFLCRMSGNAWKCYAVIVRKTTGWQKEIDYISVSQFKNLTGIKTDVTVADALKELVELNLIASVKRHGQVTGYRINMPEPSPENGGTPPPENGGTATPKNWVHPKNGTTPKNWGVLPPENGGTTTPKNWGSTKHTTKPTNTKHSISASAAADAPLSAEPPETAPAAKAKKTGRHETELSLLADYGITGQVAADFLQVRKAKRQPLTETAMRLIAADAEKCGMTALQAAEYAIASGWGSFRADWLQNKTFGRSGNRGGLTHNQTAAVPDAGSYGDMPTTDF
ncbi:TPA: replication protein [Neisseria gonorrhoeae]|uniref:replication protein n=1 Tax=Neisseria gonorrhoeae TaxID=485 RepID=UPI001C491DAE|nr:replication protein [Neisseria gonorrhoeae]MCH8711046.1 replication protein [Neisseria gonorrhoeae]QXN40793.1 replication protein [Neisseria gonorrhoeae]USJ69489.1 replication protein [Neisseria gonorrhoeae]